MVRMQIQLTEEQAAAVRREAHDRQTSIAAIVRAAVERHIESERTDLWERALAVVGKYRGGGGNVSEEHDAYLDDAYLPYDR